MVLDLTGFSIGDTPYEADVAVMAVISKNPNIDNGAAVAVVLKDLDLPLFGNVGDVAVEVGCFDRHDFGERDASVTAGRQQDAPTSPQKAPRVRRLAALAAHDVRNHWSRTQTMQLADR